MPEDIDLKWLDRYKVPALALILLACIAAVAVRETVGVASMSYIHIFYLPAIISALWFRRRALPLAVLLALVEMALNYLSIGRITPIMLFDGLAMVVIAFGISMLSGHMHRLNERLSDSNRLLQSSESSYRAIFSAASDGIVVYDQAAGRLFDVNDAWVRLTGYSVEESKAMDLARLSTGEAGFTDEDMFAHIENASREGGELFQWRIRCRDGSKAWVEINLRKVRLADRDLILAVIRDIGERMRAGEALRESEARFRVLTETTASAIVILQDNRVKYANPATEKITGYSQAELLAMSPIEATSVIDPISVMKLNMVRYLRKGSSRNVRYEIKIRARGGEIKWVDVTTGVFSYNGRQAYLATGFDITERKLADERLRASLREKEILLKEIHHRVKNNLQVVSSMLSLQSAKQNDRTVAGMLRESQDRVRSMALIHEKLYRSGDLSRINFGEYVQNLTAFLVRSYNVHGARIRLDIDVSDVLISVDLAIPCGLIINELVSNSLKYAFPGGRNGTIAVSMRRDGGEYVLVVSDDGVGIPAQVDYRNSTSLGLQLVNTLVTQLDGSLALSPERGTVFTIRFPAT